MVNGDHGESMSESRSDTWPEVLEATQGDLADKDSYEQTQQEITSQTPAGLRYVGSLLQQTNETGVIKIPLPTTTGSEVTVLFGRQSSGGPDPKIFVKLYDGS